MKIYRACTLSMGCEALHRELNIGIASESLEAKELVGLSNQ